MAGHWHVVRNGEEQGPFTSQQLREFVKAGTLLPNDGIRRGDMKDFVRASSIKDLFPTPEVSAPTVRPVSQEVVSQTGNAQSRSTALWNPQVTRVLSVFLSFGFGAYLTALNWKSLGHVAKARTSMWWFYSALAYLFVAVLSPDTPLANQTLRFLWIVFFLAWVHYESEPQKQYIARNVGDTYQKNFWGRPIGIAVGALVGCGLLAGVIR